MSKIVSLITYCDLPDLDPDDQLLKAALERHGCSVQGLIWDDKSVDWSKSGLCVLRSTWDYHKKFDEFCAWLKHVAAVAAVMNPLSLVMWNCRKTYLKELSEQGLPVIATQYFDSQYRSDIGELLAAKGWTEAIIKPTIGLATSGVKKIDCSIEGIESGEQHLDSLLASGEAMIQEYLPSVQDYGERSLMFIDGNYSHCVRKSAFQRLAVAGQAGESAAVASEEEIEIAKRILAHLNVIPLYARVDLVRDKQDRPMLLELELVEPSLFLQTCPQAAEPFASAIIKRLP